MSSAKRKLALVLVVWGAVTAGQSAPAKPRGGNARDSVPAAFGKVSNFRPFTKVVPLAAEQQKLLARNFFVCTPTDSRQLFHIYEHNDYHSLPSFVTSDTVLQLYHVFYDFTLRSVESDALTPALKRLNQGMLAESVATWNEVGDPELKAAALKNVAYFGVVNRVLGQTSELPPEAAALTRQELALIEQHQGFAQGAIFPYRLDYSQFVPRGHYTRSPALQHYFRAMMWYGLAPFAFLSDSGQRTDEQIRQGLLWVRSLYRAKLADEWATIYEPTAFYVGFSDDQTPAEWKAQSDRIFGAGPAPEAFVDADKFEACVRAVGNLRPARIRANIKIGKGVPDSYAQLRFMGQRTIPDSEILQRLSRPVQRVFPSGLDVMAVLGSQRARDILDGSPRPYGSFWPWYKPERARLTAEFTALPPGRWTSNLYWSWLHTLRALLGPAPAQAPAFMQGAAWRDKSLQTALASWAELRHDTILYGKQSVVECGGDEAEPPIVKGYVEPNVVFWDRLLQLTRQSHAGLAKRKLLSAKLKDKFDEFDDLLTFLKRVSQKELAGQKLTPQEYLDIRYLGGKIERMTVSVIEGANSWDLVNDTDKDMAVVADVHTGGLDALEEGVGHANEILVLVPVEGKLQLARGAVFSYYEFRQPIANRLTDEKWQAALKKGSAPASPTWTKSFLAPSKARRLNSDEFKAYDSGC